MSNEQVADDRIFFSHEARERVKDKLRGRWSVESYFCLVSQVARKSDMTVDDKKMVLGELQLDMGLICKELDPNVMEVMSYTDVGDVYGIQLQMRNGSYILISDKNRSEVLPS